jgi:uncharacterized protein (DUF58 family)
MQGELLKRLKHIQLRTRRLVNSSIAGDYASAFKGSGLEFDQLREYQMGDDVRFIDWHSSAKMNKIMVKQFVEERDRTVIIAVDRSSSNLFSSSNTLRQEFITDVAASLAWIATYSKDRVGLCIFADDVHVWLPPARGRAHLALIMEKLCSVTPYKGRTSLAAALRFLIKLKKKRAILFFVSDWIDVDAEYQKLLRIVNCEYDFIAVRCTDPVERSFPDVGFIEVEDLESAERYIVDTSNERGVSKLVAFLSERERDQYRMFAKNKIDLLDLTVGDSFIMPLMKFFHRRTRRQV